ncbi:Pentatricopeptide repeat-containing protein, mitochondrial [Vitis vinifera]|uniref:Pentatricopeptide repeat-containing protein, mitochondrial n=1 Tax=Vitis vinifera TaxID=29760 RepID=A0A438JMX0_VITVI|nr:Pentatricopeptide repeat-containing protein, mitochondrial [Vitis vinifera]
MKPNFTMPYHSFPQDSVPRNYPEFLSLQKNPVVCLEIFNWASQQPRFRHDVSTYHVTIKNLGAAKLYQEMDGVVNQVLAVPYIAFLRRGNNSYISHLYMEPVRRLFKQMIDDGVEPDVFSLNSMIKGYVHSLHVNDALRIFHQMGVVFNNCLPNSYTYDYLIHGLCAQGRTNNARELYDEMKRKGFIPSSKVYNSLVNALALGGQTVLDEMCRQGRTEDSMQLLKELQEKELVDGHTYRKLLNVLEDDFGNSSYRNRFRRAMIVSGFIAGMS